MTYFKDIEDYTDEELKEELTRRKQLRQQYKCSYCKGPLSKEKVCRIHEEMVGQTPNGVVIIRRVD